MREYNAPQRFWCYASEYAVELINHTAARRIKWKTPYKILHGDTPDISVFRFSFFEPIFYLNPYATFPQPNMLPGRFLGIARTTGDSFTFIITQESSNTGKNLHKSIIQKRNIREINPLANYTLPPAITHQGSMESDEPLQPLKEEDIPQNIESNEIDNDMRETILDENNSVIHEDFGKDQEPQLDIIYNHFDSEYKLTDIEEILHLRHNPDDGKLHAKIRWNNQQETYIPVDLLQNDGPMKLAKHIRDNLVERTRKGYWNTWARTTINDINNTNRKLRRMYKNITNIDPFYPYSRRIIRRQKRQFSIQMQTYLGIAIPRTVQEAISLDNKNQDSKWNDAMKKEIDGIQEHGTFEFLEPDSDVPEGYQLAPLRMIFDVKSDLRRKARLVIGGHKVDASGHTSYSSVVQLDSTRLLNVIAKAQG
jgi:hypothetical protein